MTFDIAIYKPTDRGRAGTPGAAAALAQYGVPSGDFGGTAVMADKQKIEGWDASGIRNNDSSIIVCPFAASM